MNSEDFLDVFLREELKIVNKHLPRRRASICELINMEVPYIQTSNGSIHVFDPRELEILASISGRNCNLKLPIILEYLAEGDGVYIIRDPLESQVVASILNISFSTPLYLDRTRILELRRILRTTTIILLNPGQIL